MKAVRFLSATALAGVALAVPGIAFAQTEPSVEQCRADPTLTGCVTNADGSSSNASGTIVVTGSRIARPTLSSSIPLTSVNANELLATGNVSVGDALNDLPSLRSTYTQANSNRFIGTTGLNLLDLRGLGISRTLVLVNGKRHITALPGDYIVDTNTIPADLLDRVDVITGGSSAVYGSDAVAGVVNFVLKRNFDGIRARAQGSITSRQDHGSYFASITAGRNFADGRGNIAIAAEYAQANALYFTDRDGLTGAFSGRSQFNLTTDSSLDGATGSDGIIDNQFFSGVRNGTISDGGLITAVCPTTVAAGTVLAGRCRASRVRGATANNAERYSFDTNGNLVLSVPTIDFRDVTNGGSTNTVGGLGSTLRNTGQIAPGLKRYAINLLSHFDVSDAFKPFIEAKYVRIDALQEGQPSFIQGGTLGTFSCSNPFLNAQSLATLQSIGRCANPVTGTFAVSRFNTDFGGRRQTVKRETYRIVAGAEGTFNDDWKYEFSANYAELSTHLEGLNNLQLFNLDGTNGPFLKAIDAVRNTAGQIVCRVNQTTVTDPNCVPINLFGVGAPSAAALRYVNTTALRDEKATELDLLASVSGDLSQLFELPGGPIGFAVGGEYRRETAYSIYDPLTASGATFFNAIQPFTPPSFEVGEAFGEVNVPILKDMSFAKELTISGAARYSKYKGSTGGVWAYNFGGIYAPIDDIRFRVNYSRSVRAPTASDLYSPFSQNFASIADPCDILNINNGTANRAPNCVAAGVPANFVNTPARTATLSIRSGGNQFLTAETSTSLTIGAVFKPSFIPGFTATVDFYDIKVKNLIATVSANQILNNCYDSATLNNQYCLLVSRGAGGFFNDPAVTVAAVNFAALRATGIDVDLAYNHKFDNGDRLDYRIVATYVVRRNNFLDLNNPTVPDRVKSELGDPEWSLGASVNYKHGPFGVRYSVNYVGPQTIGTYEAQNSFNGNPPQNADQFPQVYYKAVLYHNLRAEIEASKKFTFYFGVDNVTDKLPQLGLLGTGGGDGIFSPYGRSYYAGVKADF